MLNIPIISVAMCTYNGEKYIRAQLESILSQTYQSFEIIIVDDCSADNTYKILEEFAKKDARIKCYRNDTNLGFNQNFQKAVSLALGNYIAISDQDDVWKPEKLEVLLEHIGNNWLIFSNSSRMNENGADLQKKLLNGFALEGMTYKSILLINWVTGHTSLFKKEFLSYILPFPKNGYYDWWMGFVAFYHHKITYVDAILTDYRIHEKSVTQAAKPAKKKERKIYGHQSVIVMLEEFMKYKNLKPQDRSFIGELKEVMCHKVGRPFSWPLYNFIYTNYESFSFGKARRGLSKINFAFKYSRR